MYGMINCLLTKCSNTLEKIGKRELMGQKSDTTLARDILGTGQTKAFLRHDGKCDSEIDLLKRKVTAGAKQKEELRKTQYGSLSGPQLLRFNDARARSTSK